jgi:L-cysteine:1D-myo-inositol 2-amino-2-deoxy-alpha-D-glucopyranoside ligase
MRLYNSFGDDPVTFTDRREAVKIYICGITPYASTHLGHLFTYSAGDVLVRHLKHRGFEEVGWNRHLDRIRGERS